MRQAICKVKSFAIVGPYTLSIGLDDGIFREIDFSTILHGELYGPLRDLRPFEQVMLDGEVHTLVWPSGADIDPATLHDGPSQAGEVASAIDQWQLTTGHPTSPASEELHGKPLTDDDIEQSARVAFQILDQEEKRAESL